MKIDPKVIPTSIWALGFVSFFTDISSEWIHSLLPVFMVSTLGASVTAVGVVEGIAEATALITKIFSGILSDYLKKRKLLALIGYGLSACTKPLFPLSNSIGMVLAARFTDRIGKGVRGAPRDALIGDIVPAEIRGASFGLRQSLDTTGAVIGPLLAVLLMLLLADNIRTVLWIAVIPSFIAVAILARGVKEPEHHHLKAENKTISLSGIRHAGKDYWQLVAVASVLTLARFSEAFLVLKAQATGLQMAFVPMVMVVMSLTYAFSAYPAGKLSDRLDRYNVLVIGIIFLIVADVLLGLADNLWMLAIGVALWGLHMGFTQGLLAAMVTDSAPQELRGTAYGVYNVVCGVSMLIASVLAGMIWDRFSSSIMFFTGAAFTSISLLGLLLLRRKH
jgi:MFS family permease